MASQMQYRVIIEEHPFAGEGFKISRETKTVATVVKLTLETDGLTGCGECVPLKRYDYTPQGIAEQLTAFCAQHPTLADLDRLPPGPARFALDTALTDLAAQQAGQSVTQFLNMDSAHPIPTAFTLSLDTPEKMQVAARERLAFQTLKLKLGNDDLNIARLQAILDVAPHAQLILDANEAFTPQSLERLLQDLAAFPVILIEQPLPAGQDDALRSVQSPISFAADESCHTIDSLADLQDKYQVVNLKLDKTGGLHHALNMATEAKTMGFDVMVGCMGSTSLGIYPALLLAQASQAKYVDLDGALLLQNDPYGYVTYADGCVSLAR